MSVVQNVLQSKEKTWSFDRMLPYHAKQGDTEPSNELMEQSSNIEPANHLSNRISGGGVKRGIRSWVRW